MEGIFLTVLSMSWTGTLVIAGVLLARLVLSRAPKVFSYVLWAVVLLRLLCPVTVESPVGLVPAASLSGETEGYSQTLFTGASSQSKEWEQAENSPTERGDGTAWQRPQAGDNALKEAAPSQKEQVNWVELGCRIWLWGIALLLTWSVASLLRLRRTLVGAVPLAGEPGVLLADHIPSPFVLGLFRPRIYLPSDLPEGERGYILLHERTHIRRLDHLTRALAWLAAVVHWFNPAVWLAFHLAGRDMEMSCDEAVLRRTGRDIRADYSASLLRLAAGKRLPTGPLAFGDGDPQGRIRHILRYKRPALWGTLAALLAVAAVSAVLGTGRAANELEHQPAQALDELELRPVYTLDDLGRSVQVSVEGSEGDWWYPGTLSTVYETPEKALGYLSLWQPGYLGDDFSRNYSGCTALYSPEEAPDLLWLHLYCENAEGRDEVYCTVDLGTGAVVQREIPGYVSDTSLLPGREILPAARALAELIQGAWDYYAAATDLPQEEGPLPFDQAMTMEFSSGAGAWRTWLTLHPDGSFEGAYSDSEMGAGAPEYPNGIQYICQFHGRFGSIRQTDAHTWSMELEELVLDTGRPVGEKWVEDGIQYISSEPYGLCNQGGERLGPGAQFRFYTAEASGGAPGTELYGQEEFLSWWPGRYYGRLDTMNTLGCCGLHNVETGDGFFDVNSDFG